MGMRINTNIEALNAQRNLATTGLNFAKSIEKLSSGLRINRAGDDAAGLSISEKLRSQVKGLDQASRNSQDGISMIQTAEGALNETHGILQRMRELAVQAANDTLSTNDRQAIGEELLALKNEIDRIGDTTKFNGKALLNGNLATSVDAASEIKEGTYLSTAHTVVSKVDVSGAVASTTYTLTSAAAGSLTMTATVNGNVVAQTVSVAAMSGTQTLNFTTLGVSLTLSSTDAAGTAANLVTDLTTAATDSVATAAASGDATLLIGANSGEQVTVSFGSMKTADLGSGAGNNISDKIADNTAVSDTTKAQALITVIDDAVTDVSTQRSKLGALQNRLEHTIANLGVASENLATSESRIRDADLASETVSFTKAQILQQAGTAILAQANQAPQSVLQLLR